MHILKTLGWIVLTALVMMFVMVNYGEKHEIIIWPTSNDAFVLNWPVGIIALVFWLLGVLPMWLYHRSMQWSLGRRIRSLENSIKSSAIAAKRHDRTEVTSTQSPPSSPSEADDNLTSLTKSDDEGAQ